MNANRYFLYVRKSTDDKSRQVRSIEDQLADLRELAAREGLRVVEELEERRTAKMPGRPVFNAMLDRVEKGEADGIIAWHPNRLARNPIDDGRVRWLVDTGKIADLKFPGIRFENTASGKFVLGLMFNESKHYVDNLSEVIKRGIRQKVKNGIWPLVAPVGYLNDRTARVIVPDPERGPLVRRVFATYATGNYTLDQMKAAAREIGLTNRGIKGRVPTTLSRAQLHRLLSNPIYTGIMRFNGELHEGRHDPIVTREMFENVQAVLARKSKLKTTKRKPYLYRGMFHCAECGCVITTETQKGHNYLRCTKRVKKECSQRYVREDNVVEQVSGLIRTVTVPSSWTEWMTAELAAEQAADTDGIEKQLAVVADARRQIDAKLDRLLSTHLDGHVSVEEYRTAKARLLAEKARVAENIKALTANVENRFEPVTRFVKSLSEATLLASSDDAIAKRDFVKTNGSNLTLGGRRLRWEPRGAWKTVEKHGPFAHQTPAPDISGAGSAGETCPMFSLAEEVRFELTGP